eukprot:scaffold4.g4894.t1
MPTAAARRACAAVAAGTAAGLEEPEFHRLADSQVAHLGVRLGEQLREAQGQGYSFDLRLEGGRLALLLPDSARISLEKDAEQRAVVVRTQHVNDICGGGEDGCEEAFTLREDRRFDSGGEELHERLEDLLIRHLKVQLNLEPEEEPGS